MTISQTSAKSCQFFIARKQRYCHFEAQCGSPYCGHHIGIGTADVGDCNSNLLRQKCPYGNHTIKAGSFAKHLRVCPDRLYQEKIQSQEYFLKDRNSGPEPEESVQVHTLGECVEKIPSRSARAISLGPEGFQRLITKVHTSLKKLNVDIPDSILSQESSVIPGLKEKHSLQNASIVGHLLKTLLLLRTPGGTHWESIENNERAVASVEFGAGRGYLTHALVSTLQQGQFSFFSEETNFKSFLLVDILHPKNCADRLLRNAPIQRIRCNIKDFNPAPLIARSGATTWVGLGKHLCGAALDMSLRCCILGNQEKDKEGGPKCIGCAFASCCHHRCTWQHYVGREVLEDLGFTAAEFEVVSWMTGWAVCGHDTSSATETPKNPDEEEHSCNDPLSLRMTDDGLVSPAGRCSNDESAVEMKWLPRGKKEAWRPHHMLSREERMKIGMQCKKFLDAARLAWLKAQETVHEALLVRYVEPVVSGENVLFLVKTDQT